MKKGSKKKSVGNSYFLPLDDVKHFMNEAAMNNQEGVFLYAIADPGIKKLVPPPLKLVDPKKPMIYLYIVNIREPSFGPWYMEGGIGVIAKYEDTVGLYFFNLQLCGPNALMGAFSGREASGLPKKLCDDIVVERVGDWGHCYIERGGVRLVDVELEIGSYNVSDLVLGTEGASDIPEGIVLEGGCLLHRCSIGAEGFDTLDLSYYDSVMKYDTWEPATAKMTLQSSIDDPYGEIKIDSILGAGWATCDNWVRGNTVLYTYPKDTIDETMRYLLAGRFDRSTMVKHSQRYGY